MRLSASLRPLLWGLAGSQFWVLLSLLGLGCFRRFGDACACGDQFKSRRAAVVPKPFSDLLNVLCAPQSFAAFGRLWVGGHGGVVALVYSACVG